MLTRSARQHPDPQFCGIAVMAKASSPGRTKTRLSPPLTPSQAAELNTVFLKDIAGNLMLAAQHTRIAGFMAFGPPQAGAFFEAELSSDIGLFEAWLPTFGDCLAHAIAVQLDAGYGGACVLNSDSPTLPTGLLVEAARALLRPGERIVVGPSTDGGYYLLGMQRLHRRLFEDIEWSTPAVLRQTLERAAELGLETVMLSPWYDVDDLASLRLLARETLRGELFSTELPSYPAPFTRAALGRLNHPWEAP